MAAHPGTANCFFTAARDRRLLRWDFAAGGAVSGGVGGAVSGGATACARLPGPATALAVGPVSLGHLAVGFADGHLRVYGTRTLAEVGSNLGEGVGG